MNLPALVGTIRRGLNSYIGLYLLNRLPVMVYCTGRVGSIAMHRSLASHGVFAFKVEVLNPADIKPEHPGSYRWVSRHIVQPQRHAKFILIVRDPLALMVSDFFPKLKWIAGSREAARVMSVPELCDLFNTRYFAEERHIAKLRWFEDDVQVALDMDVYAHPSPAEKGYVQFTEGPRDYLIVHTELDNTTKARVVGEFAGVPDLKITRTNVGESKDYGKVYRQFKEQLVVDDAHLDVIYNSRYARHFYTPEAIEAMRQRWQGNT